jgi:hypothetical protein
MQHRVTGVRAGTDRRSTRGQRPPIHGNHQPARSNKNRSQEQHHVESIRTAGLDSEPHIEGAARMRTGRFAIACFVMLTSSACLPLAGRVRGLPETRGVLTSGGARVSRALVWQVEGWDACGDPKDHGETNSEGRFILPSRTRFEFSFIPLFAVTEFGQTWTICARPLTGSLWAWRTSSWGPSAPAVAEISCEFKLDFLECQDVPVGE